MISSVATSQHHTAGPCNSPRPPTFPMTTMHGDSFVSATSSAPRDSDVRQVCWSTRAAPRMTVTCKCKWRCKPLDLSSFLNILIPARTQHVKKPVYPPAIGGASPLHTALESLESTRKDLCLECLLWLGRRAGNKTGHSAWPNGCRVIVTVLLYQSSAREGSSPGCLQASLRQWRVPEWS